MANATILVPPSFDAVLDHRQQIWCQFEQARAQASDLMSTESRISQQAPVQPLAPFTSTGLPPAELGAALPVLNQHLAEVDRLRSAMSQGQAEIAAIHEAARKRAKTILIVSSGAILLVLVALIIAVAAVAG